MADAIRRGLDRSEKLAPGAGLLNLGAYASGTVDRGSAGAFLDLERRLNRTWSVFGQGRLGYRYGDTAGLEYGIGGGVRARW